MRLDTTKERDMPQIIVTADHGAASGEGAVMFRERVSVADFESDHFAIQLVERLGWAVGDADEVERVSEPPYDPSEPAIDPTEPVGDPAQQTTDDVEPIGTPRRERITASSPA